MSATTTKGTLSMKVFVAQKVKMQEKLPNQSDGEVREVEAPV